MKKRKFSHDGGFTLVEILVALLIVSAGLLGLGLMQAKSVKSATDAFQRSHSTWMAYEILDRMRANLNGLDGYVGAAIGYGHTALADPGSVTTPTLRAEKDLYEWQVNLAGAGGRVSLHQGVGTITQTGDIYTVTISWLGGSKSTGAETRKVLITSEMPTP